MKKNNEHNAAAAFSLILSAITGNTYSLIESPDEQNRKTSDIDYVFGTPTGMKRLVAAEHTIVESFEGEIGYGNRSFDIVAEINALCHAAIPSDRYFFLTIPDGLVNSLDRPKRKAFVAEISPTIGEGCARLRIDEHAKVSFKDHELWLMCKGNHPDMNGNVFRILKAPENGELMQRRRLARSLVEKLPKLCKYKLKRFSTALLLEDISGGLSGIGFHGKSLQLLHRIAIQLFVDYVVVFASYNGCMVVGNVWKEKRLWHKNVPYPRRYHFRIEPDGTMLLD
jgi:hypothetical protein